MTLIVARGLTAAMTGLVTVSVTVALISPAPGTACSTPGADRQSRDVRSGCRSCRDASVAIPAIDPERFRVWCDEKHDVDKGEKHCRLGDIAAVLGRVVVRRSGVSSENQAWHFRVAVVFRGMVRSPGSGAVLYQR